MYVLLCLSSILPISHGESISVCVVMFQFNITNWSWVVDQCVCCYVSVQYYKLVMGSQSVYVLLCFSSILQIGPGESTSVCVVMFQFNITNLSRGVNQCM